jgi:hypothetical protein
MVSAERERERLHARIEEFDLELTLGDGSGLSDQLVQSLLGDGAGASPRVHGSRTSRPTRERRGGCEAS